VLGFTGYFMQKIRKILNLIWNEFVYGGHLLSLGAVSIAYTAAVLLNIKATWDGLLVIYLGPQSIYLYNRYKEFNMDALTNPERTRHIEKYVKMIPLIITFFVLIFIGTLLYFNKIPALLFSLFLLFLGFSYSIFFKSFTKKIVGFKNVFVSLCWALIVVFLAVYYSYPFSLALLFIFIFIFLRLIVNTNFFDLKDIESDKKGGLLTPAIIFKSEKLLNILSFITILAALIIVSGFYLKLLPVISLFLLFTVPYSFYYLIKSQDKRTNASFLYNVVVDGEYILWLLFILIGKFLLL